MTKNLTSTSETLPAAMELDLDSFLNSPLTSDDDDDDNDKDNHHSLNSIPHRTIDEILNASVSSTSSPLTSPPSVYSRFSDPKHDQDDTVSVSTTKQPSSDFSSIPLQAQHDENPSLQLFSGVRPGINYPDDPFKRLSNSKPPRSSRGGPPVEASRRFLKIPEGLWSSYGCTDTSYSSTYLSGDSGSVSSAEGSYLRQRTWV